MDKRIILTFAAVFIVLAASVCLPVVNAEDEVDVLVDQGNGEIAWVSASGQTPIDIVRSAVESLGMTFDYSLGVIAVDGIAGSHVGGSDAGGTFSESGTTGITVSASWRIYGWGADGWSEIQPDSTDSYVALAVGFYPEGIEPVSTPESKTVWTMSRGDALNSGSQNASFTSSSDYTETWTDTGTAHATTLYVDGRIIQKYGVSSGYASVVCLDAATGEELWSFSFLSGTNYESSTPLIVGDHVYIATMTGYIYKMPWKTGPGEGNTDVTSFNGTPYSEAESVPSMIPGSELVGNTFDSGFSSMVFDSGAIYVTHSNGMVYCLDTDLRLVWSCILGGSTYLTAPTIVDGLLFTGALNGHLYVISSDDGSILTDESVYSIIIGGVQYGGVGQVAVQTLDTGNYALFFTFSDGLGMSQTNSGLAVYEYDPTDNRIAQRFHDNTLGIFGRYVLPVDADGFSGVYAVVSDGIETSLVRIDATGQYQVMAGGLAEIHAPLVLVNDTYIYAVSYASSNPVYQLRLDGTISSVAYCPSDVRNFNMIPVLVLGDTVFCGTDAGIYRLDGAFMEYVPDVPNHGLPLIVLLAIIVGVIIAVLAVVYAYLRYGRGVEKPFAYIRDRIRHYLYGDDYSHNTRSKHRLKVVVFVGAVAIVLTFTLCICVGSNAICGPGEAYSALFSAISKGGKGLTTLELYIYESRFPRALAALAIGIGLSIAGCMYQAIIRNPLVDPYIMGVSSGAGVAAIAVIAFDFTFFGLFSPHSIYLTAITACIGGLIAFGCTMLLAEKAGGSAINYVLAGVVVGLAFSAVQTIMLTMAGNKLSNALSWLYGSFSDVTWSQVWIIVLLSISMSLVPLIWAKEFNLVLLGEDQARQMGLNVRRFTRCMLILASILTSVCVAFVGVIGFVGLVIPHLCRMLLGSDHRMVFPASICFGGVMLMLADLLARTGYYGIELPVGAITTVIGIPVFAYMLIRRGKMYDG